jgi:hypothetical protein
VKLGIDECSVLVAERLNQLHNGLLPDQGGFKYSGL